MERSNMRCAACGSTIEERRYQMRAADEAHTSIWSCGSCPIDASKIDISPPAVSAIESYPRVTHTRAPSDVSIPSGRPTSILYHVEIHVQHLPPDSEVLQKSRNVRHPCLVPDGVGGTGRIGHCYEMGPYAGSIVTVRSETDLSPGCSVCSVAAHCGGRDASRSVAEVDGDVVCLDTKTGGQVYAYTRRIGRDTRRSVVIPMASASPKSLAEAMAVFCSTGAVWPPITSFLSKDRLSLVNNLSPRAWDSKRMQRRGAMYTPKIDGERVYLVVYSGLAHVFSKGKGRQHIGCIVLKTPRNNGEPIVIDAENTVSHGIFFIDMLTDSNGGGSPRVRDYAWSLRHLKKTMSLVGTPLVLTKPCTDSLTEAEAISTDMPCPTDGVIALWPGTTTARKMKIERSIELEVHDDASLVTSEGDVVFENVAMPPGVVNGHILEARIRLCRDGKSVVVNSLFRRVDKVSPNSTSAVLSILSSFGSVRRDNESKRREVLMWCDTLRRHLFDMAMKHKGSRKVVMDVGTGTGQSLDVLSPDRGVSYILVEPSKEKCGMLQKRTGVRSITTDPREIMHSMKSLKSGSLTYLIANMELSDIMADEELVSFIHAELAFVCATFSAHFTVAQLYELCTYWRVPMVGCVYPYDGVKAGGSLVDCLDVKMHRTGDSECRVRWGGDEQYTEPLTTTRQYTPFCTVARGVDMVAAPGRDSDAEVYSICSKVYALHDVH